MNDCLFCKIMNGEIPSKKIYEDDKVYAFLDINPNSNLPFKNDDEKLKFYIILLREENSCFAKYAFSLALTVKDYLAKHKDMSKRKYYNIEIKCSRNYNFNSKYFEAITRTRQLLEECIDFSDHLNI